MTLEGKVAVVTGAGGGIGHAASVALARAGASLVLVRLDEARLERPRDAVTEFGGAARHVVADVSRSKDCARYVELAGSAFGRLDVLFNNAGIEGAAAPLAAYPEEEFDRVIATNLRGVFLGLRHALPRMIERGEGSIVNSSSIAGKLDLPYTGSAPGPRTRPC